MAHQYGSSSARTNHANFHRGGYKEKGTSTPPVQLAMNRQVSGGDSMGEPLMARLAWGA